MNILGRMDCRAVSSSIRGGSPGLLQVVLHYLPAQTSPKTATRCHSIEQSESQWDAEDQRKGGWWVAGTIGTGASKGIDARTGEIKPWQQSVKL